MTALDAKSPYTAGHSKSVSDMVEILCRLLSLNRMMHIAAHLHDIVKIGIDDAILNKEGKLDYNSKKAEKNPNCINLTVLKNRHGKKGTIALNWEGDYSRISNFMR